MLDDYELIVHKFSRDVPYINVYPIGDLHIGSQQFNEDAFRRWKKTVMEDEYGKVVIVGDIMDMATKNSRTNIYEATMNPMKQKKWVEKEFGDFQEKIVGAVQGNHEYRANNLLGICPLYDVMAKLDLEDLYRPNMTFIKMNLGARNVNRQCSYTIVLAHGQAKGRTKQFPYAVDGMDIMVTGHFHVPENMFPSKVVIDSQNETVNLRPFTHVAVPSFTKLGGYTLKGMYMPQDGERFPVVRLDGTKKYVTLHWM